MGCGHVLVQQTLAAGKKQVTHSFLLRECLPLDHERLRSCMRDDMSSRPVPALLQEHHHLLSLRSCQQHLGALQNEIRRQARLQAEMREASCLR